MAVALDLTLEQKKILSKELGMRADELILDYMPESNGGDLEIGENILFAMGKTISPS